MLSTGTILDHSGHFKQPGTITRATSRYLSRFRLVYPLPRRHLPQQLQTVQRPPALYREPTMPGFLTLIEQENLQLRGRLLRMALAAVGLSELLYIGLGMVGAVGTDLYPYDAVWWICVCAFCAVLLRWRQVTLATHAFVTGLSLPMMYLVLLHGVGHANNYALMLGILVCGLLIGGRALVLWTTVYCLWMAGMAALEAVGLSLTSHPVPSVGRAVGVTILWWAVYGQFCWFVWLLDRTIRRARHVSRGQSVALMRAAAALSSETDPRRILEVVTEEMLDHLHADGLVLWLETGDTRFEVRRLALDRSITSRSPVLHSPQNRIVELWLEICTARTPRLLPEGHPAIRDIPELKGETGSPGPRLLVPVVLADETIGFVSVELPPGARPSPEDVELAQALSPAFALAVQVMRNAERDHEAAILGERNRLAREIHDTIAQSLAGIVLQIDTARAMINDSPLEAETLLERTEQLARSSLRDARHALHELRPACLQRQNLEEALRSLVQGLKETDGPKIALEIACSDPVPTTIQADLLRIAQEALFNARRHARARHIWVRLVSTEECWRLLVEDDGRGFNRDGAAMQNGRYGLLGMHERAARHGGSVRIDSNPGRGAMIQAEIPRLPNSVMETAAWAKPIPSAS
jgi:signal transduction histidine kinase